MTGQGKNRGNERRRELLGILIMAFALLIFLGLLSYHHSDYPNSGSPKVVKNWLGLIGAWFSYYLYVYTIGYSCLILPFLVFLLGWNIFLHREFKPFLRVCLYIFALGIFLSTALAMPETVSEERSKFGFRLSGLLGGFLAEQLNRYLGTVGSIVVLLTFLLLFFVSATSWSMRGTLLGFKEEMRAILQAVGKKKQRPKGQPSPRTNSDASIPIHRRGEEKLKEGRGIPKEPVPPPVVRVPAEKKIDAVKVPDRTSPKMGKYEFPPLELLTPALPEEKRVDQQALERKAYILEEKLREFDIRGSVVGIQPGPVITRFEVKPAPGIKISRFVNSQEDLALVMQAQRVRVVAPIPGKAAVGIEIPNEEPRLVTLRGLLESRAFQKSSSKLTMALGQTIDGHSYVTDLAQMPHLLVAGATGSGKSVCLNTIIVSILYRALPSEVKFILIDPKKLELTQFRRLRYHHLTTREDLKEEVITTVNNAVAVLRSLEVEMERRYRILARAGVRNIDDYNRAVREGKIPVGEEGKKPEKLPCVVLVVDELADLMVTGAREVEEPIARLAQMSRAVGIHLILATQRPSVDVITGVIKANFPSRIAFQVAAKTDSRTILDRNGAEKLLGRGDMLFLHPREPEPVRVHGAFISTEEVQRIVDYISQQPREEVWPLPGFGPKEDSGMGKESAERDELFEEAKRLVVRHQQGSVSLLQRRLRIGYARAGRLIDELEEAGIIGPFDGSKAREVLVDESVLDGIDGSNIAVEGNRKEG
jgi:S-DNA-T family DNA segregation ATPase FtsK/SpoIIIE